MKNIRIFLSENFHILVANFSIYLNRRVLVMDFHFLLDHLAYCCIFENGVLLMYALEGVSSVANFITAYEEAQ